MFLAVGVGAFSAAVFHLFAQAFIKACLFLSAGSVIHGLGGEQDMRKMGGLKPYFPITYWTYLIAALAISGAPLTAAFFSKDRILAAAYESPNGSLWFWLLAWITAGLTAFYMFRQFFMVFHGERHVAADQIHESPATMTVPLVLLALGAIFAGWLGTPEYFWGSMWGRWLEPFFEMAGEGTGGNVAEEVLLTLLAFGIASLGFLLAYLFYGRRRRLSRPFSALTAGAPYRCVHNKYYVDELYDISFVRPFTRASVWLADAFDVRVIDGIVNGVAGRVSQNSLLWRQIQTGNVQHYLLAFLLGALFVLGYYLYGS